MAERITGHTELLTLMAYPIRHSSSPAMHNEALAYLGLDYAYLCFEVDENNLKEAIASMRALKVRGGNVSMPNKIRVMEYLDEISPDAKLCGAVNTIVNEGGKLIGYNTDGIGYVKALADRGMDVKGKKLTIIGCGGVGKTMQVQAALAGASEISVFNTRDAFWDRAEETVAMLNAQTDCRLTLFDLADSDALKEQIYDSHVVSNATRVGMHPMEGQSCIPDGSFFRPGMLVTDVIYAPEETEFLRLAREAGCETMNGLGMMLFQGAASFKLWTGKDMPIAHMKEVLGV